MKLSILLAVVCLTGVPRPAGSLSLLHGAIDLSYNTEQGKTVTWPGHTPFTHRIRVRGEWQNTGIYLENNDISQGEHAGTHMDAPAHFIKGNWRVDQIPFERFSGEAVVVDITTKAR